jgi:vang-like
MSRSLQKYLRITRQQPYFTRESIISHLSTCLSHDLSPRAFLQRYIQIESQPLATLLYPALTHDNFEQSWTIICDPQSSINDQEEQKAISINQSIYKNLIFVLKQQHAEHIALICTFHQIPRIHLIEKFFDFKYNKFVLKLNSETSV